MHVTAFEDETREPERIVPGYRAATLARTLESTAHCSSEEAGLRPEAADFNHT